MATGNESPAREPPTRGRGRGARSGRAGRGRGGGRGASTTVAAKTAAAARGGRGGLRRGRAKNFSDSRVQAAYERQRDLKATYQAVAHALKPALQELAERNVDDLLQNPRRYKEAKEYSPIQQTLVHNLENRSSEFQNRLNVDLQLAEKTLNAEQQIINQQFENAAAELEDQLLESFENRLRILEALQARQLAVDIRDDQYEYKVISDEELGKDFGVYECYMDNNLVPYPSRVEGTEMWQRVREADPAASSGPSSTTSTSSLAARGKGRGRGTYKRKPLDQPEDQPASKRSTRGGFDGKLLAPPSMAPAPAKGLLAATAEAEAHRDGDGADEESVPASPEPFAGTKDGSFSSIFLQGRPSARAKSPTLPKFIGEPDDYGVRIYNQKPTVREKAVNNRVLAPRLFSFSPWEIGFRDSSNDSTKGHTRNKRGKYLDTPNSNGMHFDQWCNGYDFSTTRPKDFDQTLVKKYGIHPKYGVFLPTSTNELEDPDPYVMPGRPAVFIANPSGRVSHASRSFQQTSVYRTVEDIPRRKMVGASMRRFCKLNNIVADEVAVKEFLPTEDELRDRSLGTAIKELESRPDLQAAVLEIEEEDSVLSIPALADDERPDLSALTYAAAFIEAKAQPVPPPTPKPVRYDAIRDVFTDSAPSPASRPDYTMLGLNLLAEICNVEHRPLGSNVTTNGVLNNQQPLVPVIPADVPFSARPEPVFVAQQPDQREFVASRHEHMEPPPPIYYNPQVPPLSHQPPTPQMHQVPPPLPPRTGHYMDFPPHAQQPQFHHVIAPPTHEYQMSTGPFVQESIPYYQPAPSIHQDPRGHQISHGRPMDPRYESRSMSLAHPPNESPSERPYWMPPQSHGPPHHGMSMQHGPHHTLPPPPPPPPPPQQPQHHYSAPSILPGHSRIPFSSTASTEPLPPLRPPRARTQSLQEDQPYESRQDIQSMGPYYTPVATTRQFHNTFQETHASMQQSMQHERVLLNPHQSMQSYAISPKQGFAYPALSPTFTNHPFMPPQTGQSPPIAPHGLSAVHGHRSTPSGSSDAGSNKYRKLQPAPIPAHRTWINKPELKTIPYDHKETGGNAALPSSGPTQIRGWNVNSHRKRSKADRSDSTATERDVPR